MTRRLSSSCVYASLSSLDAGCRLCAPAGMQLSFGSSNTPLPEEGNRCYSHHTRQTRHSFHLQLHARSPLRLFPFVHAGCVVSDAVAAGSAAKRGVQCPRPLLSSTLRHRTQRERSDGIHPAGVVTVGHRRKRTGEGQVRVAEQREGAGVRERVDGGDAPVEMAASRGAVHPSVAGAGEENGGEAGGRVGRAWPHAELVEQLPSLTLRGVRADQLHLHGALPRAVQPVLPVPRPHPHLLVQTPAPVTQPTALPPPPVPHHVVGLAQLRLIRRVVPAGLQLLQPMRSPTADARTAVTAAVEVGQAEVGAVVPLLVGRRGEGGARVGVGVGVGVGMGGGEVQAWREGEGWLSRQDSEVARRER